MVASFIILMSVAFVLGLIVGRAVCGKKLDAIEEAITAAEVNASAKVRGFARKIRELL